MVRLLFLICLFYSINADAGFRRGNGGFILICQQPQSQSYHLLDLFEGESRYGFQMAFSDSGDEFQRAQAIIDRLLKLNPTRHSLYSRWLQDFPAETRFLEGLNIISAPDIGVTFIPDHCTPKQLIVQVEPLSQYDKRYTVDQRLWRSLDVNHRAAAILHELIYREAISMENQHNSSEPSRLLNAYLHSTALATANLKDWLLFIQEVGFHRADAHGLEIRLNSFSKTSNSGREKTTLDFHNVHTVALANLPHSLDFQIGGAPRYYECADSLYNSRNLSYISFYPNGQWQHLSFSSALSTQRCPDFYLNILDKEDVYSSPFAGPVYLIHFDVTGNISMVAGTKSAPSDDPNMKRVQNKLLLEGHQILVSRNFEGLSDTWGYMVQFNAGRPVLLINSSFNSDKSMTYLKQGDERILIPNQERQEIY